MNCVLCGNSNYKTLVNMNFLKGLRRILFRKDDPSPIIRGHNVLRYAYCLDCGLIFQEFPPSDDCLSEFYRTWRSNMTEERFKKYTETKISEHLKRIKWIEEDTDLSSIKGKILDVGTSDGSLCGLFRKKGWDSYGVEHTQKMVKYSRRFYKDIKIIDKAYSKELFPDKYFDLIVLSHCLEHFRNPFEAIDICSYHLKENGYLFIEVPTFMSTSFREFISSHLFIFTKNSLITILSKQGYNIKKIEILFFELNEQPQLTLLCQKSYKVNIPTIPKIYFKKEYKKFKLLVAYRYIYLFTIRPLLNSLKKNLKKILPYKTCQRLKCAERVFNSSISIRNF